MPFRYFSSLERYILLYNGFMMNQAFLSSFCSRGRHGPKSIFLYFLRWPDRIDLRFTHLIAGMTFESACANGTRYLTPNINEPHPRKEREEPICKGRMSWKAEHELATFCASVKVLFAASQKSRAERATPWKALAQSHDYCCPFLSVKNIHSSDGTF